MPWEKSFDEDATLEKAMRVFWEKGFDSASIADLIEGTGVNRGSLYNAFGGKQSLFIKTLSKYDRDNRLATLARLEALDDPRKAISEFFDTMVIGTIADTERKGCFLFNTLVDTAAKEPEVHEIVANGLREIEGFLRRCIEVGQARGDIPKHHNPEAKAKALLALAISIRALGRGSYSEAGLQTIADQAKQLIA